MLSHAPDVPVSPPTSHIDASAPKEPIQHLHPTSEQVHLITERNRSPIQQSPAPFPGEVAERHRVGIQEETQKAVELGAPQWVETCHNSDELQIIRK
ncbi:hypothetical protein HK102_008895, partial [Quaeritorhiza haematococci]